MKLGLAFSGSGAGALSSHILAQWLRDNALEIEMLSACSLAAIPAMLWSRGISREETGELIEAFSRSATPVQGGRAARSDGGFSSETGLRAGGQQRGRAYRGHRDLFRSPAFGCMEPEGPAAFRERTGSTLRDTLPMERKRSLSGAGDAALRFFGAVWLPVFPAQDGGNGTAAFVFLCGRGTPGADRGGCAHLAYRKECGPSLHDCRCGINRAVFTGALGRALPDVALLAVEKVFGFSQFGTIRKPQRGYLSLGSLARDPGFRC